ncbi:MAG: TetR family transcriptional regulator [Gordonia sp. (in: high G+C Gram-positive bacteria)]|uniref:TetR family transcriptional regulator n=1 Tax=Gordonia sp. (in: high G+C Gram-positive bacteria) TaxID=84139 RepID=UPI0039E661E3
MGNTRADILHAARAILSDHSLADLTMRRLATEVGVRPNALYWHFPNKQSMLAALADDLLADVDTAADLSWDDGLRATAVGMRAALLAVPDSAEVVSSAWASGLAENDLAGRLSARALDGGLSPAAARGVATGICQLTIGLTIEEQTRSQMERLGVIGPSGRDFEAEFTEALEVILDGARAARRAHDVGAP